MVWAPVPPSRRRTDLPFTGYGAPCDRCRARWAPIRRRVRSARRKIAFLGRHADSDTKTGPMARIHVSQCWSLSPRRISLETSTRPLLVRRNKPRRGVHGEESLGRPWDSCHPNPWIYPRWNPCLPAARPGGSRTAGGSENSPPSSQDKRGPLPSDTASVATGQTAQAGARWT